MVGNFPPHEAFAIGGTNSVRGYEEGAVGSGRSYAVGSGEISFPLVSGTFSFFFFFLLFFWGWVGSFKYLMICILVIGVSCAKRMGNLQTIFHTTTLLSVYAKTKL